MQETDKKFIVIAEVETEYENCQVIEAGANFAATHRKVFGPDSREACERWKQQNCR